MKNFFRKFADRLFDKESIDSDINIKEKKNLGKKNSENYLKKISQKNTPPLKKEKTRNLKSIKKEKIPVEELFDFQMSDLQSLTRISELTSFYPKEERFKIALSYHFDKICIKANSKNPNKKIYKNICIAEVKDACQYTKNCIQNHKFLNEIAEKHFKKGLSQLKRKKNYRLIYPLKVQKKIYKPFSELKLLDFYYLTIYPYYVSIEDFNYISTAISRNPNSFKYYLKRGYLNTTRGLNHFKEKYQRNSNSIKKNIGEWDYKKLENAYKNSIFFYLKEAIEDLNKAIHLNPKNIDCYLLKSICLDRLNERDDSAKELELAKKFKSDVKNMVKIAYIYSDFLDDKVSSIDLLNKCLNIDSKNANLFFLRGRCHSLSCNFVKALEDLSSSIELDPSYAKGFALRAECAIKLKKKRGVLRDLSKAIELSPEIGYFYYIRAKFRYENKDYDGALCDFFVAKVKDRTITDVSGWIEKCESKFKK